MDRYEDAILTAASGTEVQFKTDLMRIKMDREMLHQAALRVTSVPVAIFTRTDKDYQPYFLVRKYDTSESISYEQMEKEAKDNGWIE